MLIEINAHLNHRAVAQPSELSRPRSPTAAALNQRLESRQPGKHLQLPPGRPEDLPNLHPKRAVPAPTLALQLPAGRAEAKQRQAALRDDKIDTRCNRLRPRAWPETGCVITLAGWLASGAIYFVCLFACLLGRSLQLGARNSDLGEAQSRLLLLLFGPPSEPPACNLRAKQL